jgi:DNA-binding response OmpR family regulator
VGERPGAGLVLIIEDDEPILHVLRDVVVDVVGATALSVLSPAEVHASQRPDLVITDLVGYDAHHAAGGREYLSRLRARFGSTPLLLLTAQQWVRAGTHGLPVDAIVLKPFDLDDLATRIRALLGARRRPAAVTTRSAAREDRGTRTRHLT